MWFHRYKYNQIKTLSQDKIIISLMLEIFARVW